MSTRSDNAVQLIGHQRNRGIRGMSQQSNRWLIGISCLHPEFPVVISQDIDLLRL
jgi:hypothetical protein